MITLTDIKISLTVPVQRQNLINFLSLGGNLPAQYKALAYISLNGMSQDELNNVATIALKVIEYLEAGNEQGLNDLLIKINLPKPIIEMIVKYGNNIIKNQ